MSNRKYLLNLSLKNIIHNKSISTLIITAIVLVVGVLYTSLNIGWTIYDISRQNNLDITGNYHYIVYQDKEIELSGHYEVTKEYIDDVHYLDNSDVLPFEIIEGRFPENDKEIIVPDTFNKEIVSNFEIVGVYQSHQNIDHLYSLGNKGCLSAYYIRDYHIEWSTSLEGVAELLEVSKDSIVLNDSLISADVLSVYLENPLILFVMFGIFIFFGIVMSYMALKNVFLMNKNKKKKEIGLMKSIGLSPKQTKRVLEYEFFLLGILGAIFGIVLGCLISSILLNLVLEKINLSNYVINYIRFGICIICILLSLIETYIVGMRMYKQCIYTNPINDINDGYEEFPKPIQSKSSFANQFSWRLFLIYNHRLKEQTKNVRNSFILVLISLLLFCFITLSNSMYKINGTSDECDIVINNISYDGKYSTLNLDFVYALYNEQKEGNIKIDYIITERVSNNQILTRERAYIAEYVSFWKQRGFPNFYLDKNRISWCDQYFYPTILDQEQLTLLQNYIIEGRTEGLTNNDYICILSDGLNYYDSAYDICKVSSNTGIGVYPKEVSSLKSFIENQSIQQQNNIVRALAVIPNDKEAVNVLLDLHLPVENTEYIMAQSYQVLDDNLFEGTETIKIKLVNSSLVFEFQKRVKELLIEYGVSDLYIYDNWPLSVETTRFTIYMMDVFLYPICLLILMIALLNIFNVFRSNMLLKQNDIYILKSIGMQYSQIRKMIVFENLEGYINATFIVSVSFLILALIVSKLAVNSLLSIDIYIVSTILITMIIIGPLIISVLCLLSLTYLKNIYDRG